MQIKEHVIDLVTNSVEAGAKHVLIMLSEEGGSLALAVSDDGCGITEEAVRQALSGSGGVRGNGLRLIKQAAESKGGTFEIAGTPQRGTEVRAVFPTGWDASGIGAALIVFWQELPIMDFTLSATSTKGSYCFDSRLIASKYGATEDMETMVKVRDDINLNITNLFGGN